MRVIPSTVPSFPQLSLPEELKQIVGLRNGIVLVTGPTGSGKSSTLAAIIDLINQQHSFHILTIDALRLPNDDSSPYSMLMFRLHAKLL